MKNEKKEKSEKNRKKPRKPEISMFLRGTAGKLLFLVVKEKWGKAGPERPASFFQKIFNDFQFFSKAYKIKV